MSYEHLKVVTYLNPKVLSDQIWIASCIGQPMTYPYFIIFSSDLFGKMPKVISYKGSFHSYKTEL